MIFNNSLDNHILIHIFRLFLFHLYFKLKISNLEANVHHIIYLLHIFLIIHEIFFLFFSLAIASYLETIDTFIMGTIFGNNFLPIQFVDQYRYSLYRISEEKSKDQLSNRGSIQIIKYIHRINFNDTFELYIARYFTNETPLTSTRLGRQIVFQPRASTSYS